MSIELKLALLLCADPDLRPFLTRALRQRGFDVVAPLCVAELEPVLGQGTIDVVVWNDPNRDSWEYRGVRELRGRCQVPIVFVLDSSQDRAPNTELSRELEVAMIAYKPVVARDFATQVVALVTRSQPSTKPDSGNFAIAFEPLKQEFGARLPERLAELEAAVEKARTDRNATSEARKIAHRLRGSAGSYGYGAVGAAVGLVEDLLADVPAPPAPVRRLFWEDVARALTQARRESSQVPAEGSPPRQSAANAPRALLVVDEDPEFLQLARQTGRKLVLDVVTAESPDEAIQRARTTPLLGVLLGLPQKGSSWSVLAHAIRATPHNSDVPIAFASSDGILETRMAALDAGGSRFFEKPLSDESLTALAQDLVALAAQVAGRVLIVDDDPDVVQLYALLLRGAGIEVTSLPSTEGIVEELERLRPDVLLLDVDLPEISGLDVCRALRMSPQFQLLPILMVTARCDAATRLSAFRAGATDVVTKPVIPEELSARVGLQLERIRLLRERADRDALSGLLLRRALIEAFQRTLAGAVRHDQPLALVLLDLDSFKRINDEHGHLAGDQVIARLGDLLRRRFRVEDLRGRWGGEEFVLVFPGANGGFAERATLRLLEEFSTLEFSSDAGQSFHATFTAGIAEYPGDGTALSHLVRHADEQLYLGKKLGRNRVCRSGVTWAPAMSHKQASS